MKVNSVYLFLFFGSLTLIATAAVARFGWLSGLAIVAAIWILSPVPKVES